MKIGMLPRQGAENIYHSGLGDVRWSSNIYFLLKQQGYDVEYIPLENHNQCDLYLDIHLLEQCKFIGDKKHIHLSFYSQPLGREYRCFDGELTSFGTCYRKTYNEDMANSDNLKALFCPMPYPNAALPRLEFPAFERKEITWGIRRCFQTTAQKEYTENFLRALKRLNDRTDFRINFIDYDEVKQAEPLINQLRNVHKFSRISWKEVLEMEARTKLVPYHNDLSGASVNEAIFCGAVPIMPANNCFRYVPPGTGNFQSEQYIYENLERLWFDRAEYRRQWEFYQDTFFDHREPRVGQIWAETLISAMDTL